MKSSARNQFSGTVVTIREGAINDEVELEIAPGQHLVSTVTRESRHALQLDVGRPALALIKASSVLLVIDSGNLRFSARNQLSGAVEAIVPGAVNDEVTLRLPGGLGVVAVITHASARDLGLKPGDKATALFKASSVFLATTA